MFYQKILLAGFMPEDEPTVLPDDLLGLSDVDLSDLSWTETQYKHYGYWPVFDETAVPVGYERGPDWVEISVDRDERVVRAKRNIRPIGLINHSEFTQTLIIEQGSGNGVRFWDGLPDLSIYAADSQNSDWGGRVLDENASGKNLYFRTGGKDGWVFRNGDVNVAGIDHQGNIRIRGVAYMTLPSNNWLKSGDGIERVYFTRGGRTILKSGDGGYELRNASDTELMTVFPTGDVNLYGTLKTSVVQKNGGVWIGASGDIVDLGDHFASMRFAGGVKVYSGNKGGTAVITLGSDGHITTVGSVIGQSDRRVKTDIRPLDEALALAKNLKPSRFVHNGVPGIGFIAQDVQEVLPELVVDRDGLLHVNYPQMVAVAVAAIKELECMVEAQQEKIALLEARLRRIELHLSDDGK